MNISCVRDTRSHIMLSYFILHTHRRPNRSDSTNKLDVGCVGWACGDGNGPGWHFRGVQTQSEPFKWAMGATCKRFPSERCMNINWSWMMARPARESRMAISQKFSVKCFILFILIFGGILGVIVVRRPFTFFYCYIIVCVCVCVVQWCLSFCCALQTKRKSKLNN